MSSTGATQPVKKVHKIQLKVLVDKERKKVVYAEVGKDFVDILFSFLTFPLGTIARLVAKESNIGAVRVGSLSSLYQSVADLDEQYLSTPRCKEMLLKPKNAMVDYCWPLKLNIDDTETVRYFRCTRWECNRSESESPLLSTFRNHICSCGREMDREVSPQCLNLDNGFVKESATFIISDDLYVMPNGFRTIASLLQKHGVDDSDPGSIQEHIIGINYKKEVIDLLKLSLLSKTPLTDFIFKNINKLFLGDSIPKFLSEIGNEKVVSSGDARQMDLKVMVRKSTGEIVFVEAEEDFADFLFSFLTFPLGGVLHMLQEFSLGCLSNLYESMKELSPDRYLISQDLRDKLVKPKIAPQFDLTNQILPFGAAASLPVFYCHTYHDHGRYFVDLSKEKVVPKNSNSYVGECVQFSFVDPKSSCSKSSSSKGFAKGPSVYMVTGDLVVTPMSYAYVMPYLNRSKVSLFDLEEKVIKIRVKEALCILEASLVTANALTNCLNQFIGMVKDPVKKERIIKDENCSIHQIFDYV